MFDEGSVMRSLGAENSRGYWEESAMCPHCHLHFRVVELALEFCIALHMPAVNDGFALWVSTEGYRWADYLWEAKHVSWDFSPLSFHVVDDSTSGRGELCACRSPEPVVMFCLQRNAGPGGAELHTCDCRKCSQCQHEAVCLQGKGNLFTLCYEFSITMADIMHKWDLVLFHSFTSITLLLFHLPVSQRDSGKAYLCCSEKVIVEHPQPSKSCGGKPAMGIWIRCCATLT